MKGLNNTLRLSMQRVAWFLPALTLVLALAGTTDNPASAQANCPVLVDQVLAAVADNCDSLEHNHACYGHDHVSAELSQDVTPDAFSTPADTVRINDVRTIRTSPMNLDESVWGVSLLNVQAGVPQTLPGQVVRFLLLGDAQLENAVPPDEAQTSASPLQAFRLNTGDGPAGCEAAPPDSMLVQGPEDIRVNLTVNGVAVRLASTMLLQGTSGEGVTLNVLAGEAHVENTTVRAGQQATFCAPSNTGCMETGPVPIPDGLAERLASLADLDSSILNYRISVSESGVMQPAPTSTPEPDSAVSSSTQTEYTTTGPDCAGFKATSPLGGIGWRDQTFYWDPAPGAARYRVSVHEADRTLIARGMTTDTTMTLSVGIQDDVGVTNYHWQVEALDENGVVICTSDLITSPVVGMGQEEKQLDDDDPTDEPVSTSEPFGWDSLPACVGAGEVEVSWVGAQPGEDLTIEIYDNDGLLVADKRTSGVSGTETLTFAPGRYIKEVRLVPTESSHLREVFEPSVEC